MSRCFPYPPPGYKPSRASNEALIVPIKLQSEWEKTKSERKKENKREKKEKKKAKEEKPKQIKAGHFDHGENWVNVKDGFLQKERKDDGEQLERSSITEEHEQPICSQNPSYSSDSTQNSSKRKRHALPLNGTHAHGNILRIRLPSQKHIQHVIRVGEEQLCSTSGRTDLPAKNNTENATRTDPDKSGSVSRATDCIDPGLPLRPSQERTQPNSSHQTGNCSHENLPIDSGSKRSKKLQRVAERYRGLIEEWIPPSQLSEYTDDDEDWLFGRKHQENHPEKKVRISNEMSCSSSSSLWPRAHHLHDADVYALPFTVPF